MTCNLSPAKVGSDWTSSWFTQAGRHASGLQPRDSSLIWSLPWSSKPWFLIPFYLSFSFLLLGNWFELILILPSFWSSSWSFFWTSTLILNSPTSTICFTTWFSSLHLILLASRPLPFGQFTFINPSDHLSWITSSILGLLGWIHHLIFCTSGLTLVWFFLGSFLFLSVFHFLLQLEINKNKNSTRPWATSSHPLRPGSSSLLLVPWRAASTAPFPLHLTASAQHSRSSTPVVILFQEENPLE